MPVYCQAMSPRRAVRAAAADRDHHTAAAGFPDPTPLLLATDLPPAEVDRLLAPYGFEDTRRADANLQAMAGEPRSRQSLASILAELLETAAQTADPDQALNRWEQFLRDFANRVQLFDYLRQVPRLLHFLCSVFGNSPALAQTLVRDPMLVYWLVEERVLTRLPSRAALARVLDDMLRNFDSSELKLDAIRRFRRREVLRIGGRDLLGLSDVRRTTAALSDLASVLIQAAFEIVEADLRRQYGSPTHRDRSGHLVETGFAVIGMGKLGGRELNFSSDVDLIYVYAADEDEKGREAHAGPAATPTEVRAISNEEYFDRLAGSLTRALESVTHEGRVLRVDLRLRADGSVGRLAMPLSDCRRYYGTRGAEWERLAFLKAWPVAGDRSVGRAFLRIVRPFVFPNLQAGVENLLFFKEVREIKEMIDRKMAERGETGRNVKLGTGGIREIEFLVQAIQVACGRRLAGIRDRSTLGALQRFEKHGLLSGVETEGLSEAYRFLRDVEHKLQMVHDLQTHELPVTPGEIARCAIRMGFAGEDRQVLADRFMSQHRRHTAYVNRIFRSFFYESNSSLLNTVQQSIGKEA
ncbi:MAG: hypothetical protein HY650_03755 [Acidobacteria bacterium]|nr:hypothetical protein [Acidobacteriota bacterium]